MVATSQVDKQSRQSSAGKSSFFGRRLHKDRPTDSRNVGSGGLDSPAPASTNGSWSSRHTRRESVASVDDQNDGDPSGLAMMSGVITSIPYDATADARAPVAVDYLPAADKVPVHAQPHHLNKGSDFHQYPAWNGTPKSSGGSSSVGGPRPQPPIGSLTMASSQSGDRGTKLQQWGKSGSATAPQHNNYDSFSTSDSSTGQRKSFDQGSTKSSISSATRGSSLFSSDNSSRTAVPSARNDLDSHSILSPASSRLSKVSRVDWPTQQPVGFNSTTSFAPQGFYLPRPDDDALIEQQFIELMHKRGWQNLPDQARRQMLAYAPAKKWTLVHQDRLTEWQGEQKRKQHNRQTYGTADGGAGVIGRSDEEGSPEWYVRKVMDDSITAKQLGSLSVSLRTQPIE
jgi:cytokinesis protein